MRSAPAIAPWTVCHSSPSAVMGWKTRCRRIRNAARVPSEMPNAANASRVPAHRSAATARADRIAVTGV